MTSELIYFPAAFLAMIVFDSACRRIASMGLAVDASFVKSAAIAFNAVTALVFAAPLDMPSMSAIAFIVAAIRSAGIAFVRASWSR